jgi:hypothetical protein
VRRSINSLQEERGRGATCTLIGTCRLRGISEASTSLKLLTSCSSVWSAMSEPGLPHPPRKAIFGRLKVSHLGSQRKASPSVHVSWRALQERDNRGVGRGEDLLDLQALGLRD